MTKNPEELFRRLVKAIREDDQKDLTELRAMWPAIGAFVAENPQHEILNTPLQGEDLVRLLNWLSAAPEPSAPTDLTREEVETEYSLHHLERIERRVERQAAELNALWEAWARGDTRAGLLPSPGRYGRHWEDAWNAWIERRPFSFLERLPQLEEDPVQATLLVVDRVSTTLESFLRAGPRPEALWIDALTDGDLVIESGERLVNLEIFRAPYAALGFNERESVAVPCAVIYALPRIPGLLEPLEPHWGEDRLMLELSVSREKERAPLYRKSSERGFMERA